MIANKFSDISAVGEGVSQRVNGKEGGQRKLKVGVGWLRRVAFDAV